MVSRPQKSYASWLSCGSNREVDIELAYSEEEMQICPGERGFCLPDLVINLCLALSPLWMLSIVRGDVRKSGEQLVDFLLCGSLI